MPNIDSLYELTSLHLIKKISQQQKKPLKIICDWDEYLMPVRPWASYLFSSKQIPFEGGFFKDFWENTFVESGSVGGYKSIEYKGKNEETRKAVENFRMMKKRRREGSKEPDFYSTPERLIW